MTDRSEQRRCPRCGAELAAEGFCPRCCLESGLSSPREIYDLYLEGARRGEVIDFDAFCEQFPEMKNELRQLHGMMELGRDVVASRSLREVMREKFGDLEELTLSLESPEPLAAHAPALEPSRGEREGRYRLEATVAEGGMGVVYRIHDRDLNRHLAMKVMRRRKKPGSGGRTESEEVSRFLEEAQITAQLDHPAIVPVHEVGFDREGQLFFTMKLVQGREFGEVMKDAREGRNGWNLSRAVGVLIKACQALAFSHDKGVIHRDLKPANIMVGDFGEVYVMDWGLARVEGRRDLHDIRLDERAQTRAPVREDSALSDSPLVTLDGTVLGTPAYMSPEQACAEIGEVGVRSDIYALGAILYELLSGAPPYVDGEGKPGPRELLEAIRRSPPESLAERARTAPAELAAICHRAMAWRPGDRYDSVLGMSEDLQAFLDQRVVRAYRTGAWAEFRSWVLRNKLSASAAAMLLVLLLMAGLAGYVLEGRSDRAYRRQLYISELGAAGEAWNAGQYSNMEAFLNRCPPELRHWEWHFLDQQKDRWEGKLFHSAGETADLARITPGGEFLILSTRPALKVFDYASGDLRWERALPSSYGVGVAASVPLERLAFTSGLGSGEILLFSLTTGELQGRLAAGSGVRGLAFVPGGAVLMSGSEDGEIALWDTESGQLIRRFRPVVSCNVLDLSPGGERVVVGGGAGSVAIVNLATEEVERRFKLHAGVVQSVKFGPEGDLLFASPAGLGVNGDESQLWNLREGWSAAIPGVAYRSNARFSVDGNRLLTSGGNQFVIRDLAGTGQIDRVLAHASECTSLDFGPEGQIMTSSETGDVMVWRERSPSCREIRVPQQSLRTLSLSRDGSLVVAGGTAGDVHVMDTVSGEERGVYAAQLGPAPAVAFGPEGRRVATGSFGGELDLWDMETSRKIWEVRLEDGIEIWWVQFSADSRWVVSSSPNGTIRVWDARTGGLIRKLDYPNRRGTTDGMALSPNGKFIAACDQAYQLTLWSTETWKTVWTVREKPDRSVVFTPDSRHVIVANGDGLVNIRSVKEGGRLVRSLRAHQVDVLGLAVSGDGKRLFTCSADGEVGVWELPGGAKLMSLRVPSRTRLWHVALSGDGKVLAVAGNDGVVTVWRIGESVTETSVP